MQSTVSRAQQQRRSGTRKHFYCLQQQSESVNREQQSEYSSQSMNRQQQSQSGVRQQRPQSGARQQQSQSGTRQQQRRLTPQEYKAQLEIRRQKALLNTLWQKSQSKPKVKKFKMSNPRRTFFNFFTHTHSLENRSYESYDIGYDFAKGQHYLMDEIPTLCMEHLSYDCDHYYPELYDEIEYDPYKCDIYGINYLGDDKEYAAFMKNYSIEDDEDLCILWEKIIFSSVKKGLQRLLLSNNEQLCLQIKQYYSQGKLSAYRQWRLISPDSTNSQLYRLFSSSKPMDVLYSFIDTVDEAIKSIALRKKEVTWWAQIQKFRESDQSYLSTLTDIELENLCRRVKCQDKEIEYRRQQGLRIPFNLKPESKISSVEIVAPVQTPVEAPVPVQAPVQVVDQVVAPAVDPVVVAVVVPVENYPATFDLKKAMKMITEYKKYEKKYSRR